MLKTIDLENEVMLVHLTFSKYSHDYPSTSAICVNMNSGVRKCIDPYILK